MAETFITLVESALSLHSGQAANRRSRPPAGFWLTSLSIAALEATSSRTCADRERVQARHFLNSVSQCTGRLRSGSRWGECQYVPGGGHQKRRTVGSQPMQSAGSRRSLAISRL